VPNSAVPTIITLCLPIAFPYLHVDTSTTHQRSKCSLHLHISNADFLRIPYEKLIHRSRNMPSEMTAGSGQTDQICPLL